MHSIHNELLVDYLAECEERLQRLHLELDSLHRERFDNSVLRVFYREIHTIKGSSQLFGFKEIASICHSIEDCLDRNRGVSRENAANLVTLLFDSLKAVNEIFGRIKDQGRDNENGKKYPELKLRLESFPELTSENEKSPSLDSQSNDPMSNFLEISPSGSSNVPVRIVDDTSAETIRVHIDLLDNLASLVGELVSVKSELCQISQVICSESLKKAYNKIDGIAAEIQRNVVASRMTSLESLNAILQKVAKNLSDDLNKPVDFDFFGSDFEIDRSLLEAIKDPLIHVIRNAIDHGIESLDVRRAFSKKDYGKIVVNISPLNGNLVIDVSDDGHGIDADMVRSKALEKGLLTPDLLKNLSDFEAIDLIFLPGFTTSDSVSNVSGRGFGMDIVKSKIELVGGKVSIETNKGIGTLISFSLPQTFVVMAVLQVRACNEWFIVRQSEIIDIISVNDFINFDRGRFEKVSGRIMCVRKSIVIPIIDLNEKLFDEKIADFSGKFIIFLEANEAQFGLLVDDVSDLLDVVIKPISILARSDNVFTSAAIISGGIIALLIDVNRFAHSFIWKHKVERLGLLSSRQRNQLNFLSNLHASLDSVKCLLVKCLPNKLMVIRLEEVLRVVRFDVSDLRFVGSHSGIYFLNRFLPIFSKSLDFNRLAFTEASKLAISGFIVIISNVQGVGGFFVDELHDVVDVNLIDLSNSRSVPGSRHLIYKELVLEVLDVDQIVTDLRSKYIA